MRWRVRAEVIGFGTPAPVVDDQANVEGLGLVRALPCFPEKPRLIGGGQGDRFADVDVGRAQADDGANDRIEDVPGGNDQEAHRAANSLGEGHDVGEQPALVRGRRVVTGFVRSHVHVDETCGHDNDVSVAGRVERRDDVRQGVRVPDRHQHVAGACVDLIERQFSGWKQVEVLALRRADGGHRTARREPHRQQSDKRRSGDRWDVANREHGEGADTDDLRRRP